MAVITPSLALWGDKKEWTKEELVSQLKPMCTFYLLLKMLGIFVKTFYFLNQQFLAKMNQMQIMKLKFR